MREREVDRNAERDGTDPCRANDPDDPALLETLARSDDGSVRLCDGCGRIHVRFGNLLLVRDREGYGLLRDYVDELASMALTRAGRSGDRDPPPLYLLAFRKEADTAFCFEAGEVFELQDLLSRADALIEAGSGRWGGGGWEAGSSSEPEGWE